MEALTGRHSIDDLCKRYDLLPDQISNWKKYFLENSSLVFSQEDKSDKKDPQEALIQKLYDQIGELTASYDFLKKNLS